MGGAGGEGADAPDNGGFRRGGGDGGDGGHAGSVQSADATLYPGVAGVYGTDGGDGDSASSGFISGSQVGASGGGGGAGGYGIYGIYGGGNISLTLSGSGVVSGGKGGKGGKAGENGEFGRGGDGGDGGIGVYFDSASVLDNQVTIIGGKGGDGADGAEGSDGAAGGAGVYALNGLTLNNSGTITGANGGKGGEGRFGDGVVGAGGWGVFGSDMDITTSGAISGGLFGDGETRAAAILFVSGANSLTLQEGWSLTGDLVVNDFGSSLTLKLDGIDADVSNTITGQGGVIVDVGPQVLTLSGVNTYKGGTTISSGTLSVASEAALGDGVHLKIGAPVNGVTGLSDAASTLSSAISTYASAPTAENAAALAAAQASYRQAIGEGQASGEMPTLQITGSVSLDPATDSAIAIAGGKAGAIRLEGADAGLTLHGFQSGMLGSAVVVSSGGVLDLGVGEGQTQGYVFSGSYAASMGGAVENESGTVSIAGATFGDNSAVFSGGAIGNAGVMALSDSTFTGNSSGTGGAISQGGTLLVERSGFAGNDAQSSGGAIYATGGSMVIVQSGFSGNSAGDAGGAIYARGGAVNLSIVDSDFIGNSAGVAGGAIGLEGATLNLMVSDGFSSQFSGNTAADTASSIHLGTGLAFTPTMPPEYIYVASTLNVGTGTGALLDMRDPMSGKADNVTNTVTKSGAGTWALGGANVFAVSGTGSADFAVSQGWLYLYAAGEVDNPTTDDEDAVVGAGTIQLDGTDSAFTLGADGTLVAGGANSVATAGTITFEDGATLRGGNADTAMGGTDPTFKEKGGATSLTLTATGGITLEGTLNVAALGATDSFTLNGALGGEDGALAKSGAGTVILTSASTFAAGTTISGGTLALSGSGALATTGAVTLDGATGVFDLSAAGGARIIGDLSGIAGSSVVLGENTLTVGGSGETTFAGSFEGDGELIKSGTGVMTLTGTNAHTGLTTVSSGTLLVGSGGSGSLAGAVQVEAAGTLGGSGTIGGAATVFGTLSAGNSPGTLAFQDDLTLDSGSTSSFQLNTPGINGGTGNDLVQVDGTLTLAGTLDASVGAAGFYTLFTYGTLASGSSFSTTDVTGTGGFEVETSIVAYGTGTNGAVTLLAAGEGQTVQFWDGTQLTGDGTVQGGTGTWNAAGTNWTGAPGSADANGPWIGSVGVFMGTAGTVTVDDTQVLDTLQFKTDGYVLTGGTLALAPASGSFGTFSTDSGVTATIESLIADGPSPAGLTKSGAGTLVLTASNSYSGGTKIDAGTLSVSSNANLGATAGGLAIGDATLATTGSFGTARAVSLTGAATFDVASGTTLGLTGTVAGSGSLGKTGTGTLILSGSNSYEGGTKISGGIVSVSADANLGAAMGEIVFGGGTLATTASFDSARDITLLASSSIDVAAGTTLGLSGDVTGTGTLAKLGSGDLALSGASSVNWSLDAGRLSADAAGFSGAVALAAGTRFDLSATSASTYAGTLSGTGTFVKDGAGLLTYSGNGAAFTGLTEIAEGRLAVNGVLGGDVDVLSGGTLGGAGTVGTLDVAPGGRVGPGNSAGTLTVAGDATFAAGSVYEVEIHGDGMTDLLAIHGTAYLNGGLVELTALDPKASYRTGQTYTILTAQDGVVGAFDGLESLSPFLRGQLGQSDSAVNVTIAVEYDFTTVAATPNQYATAAALDTLGQRGAALGLYNALLFLPTGSAARGAFDQLSGEVHASAQSVFMEQSGLVRGALNDRLRAAQGGVGAAAGSVVSVVETAGGALAYAAPSKRQRAAETSLPLKAAPLPVPAEKFALWSAGFGNWGAFDGTANATGITDSTGGFLIGADTLVGDVWRVGIGGGYSYTSFSAAGRASSGNSDNWHAALYAGRSWDALALRTGLAYTWQDVTTSRSVAFAGFADHLSADYSAGTFQAFGEFGYRIDMAFAAFEPFANLAYVSLDRSGYTETGGAAALRSNGTDMNTGFSTLGLRVAKELTFGVHATTLRGAIGWRQAFGDITPAMSQAFLTSGTFTVTGTPIAETAAVLEAGLDMRLGAGATLGVAYSGQFGEGVEQNGFNASLKASF
ncbi:autotransporter domain-containing protein [Ancylobacter sp.]|uniref:autotransporter domain-containing protein n=1 Tax=Ancylobacter sp. TaxID=1872567 RepID=UPI003D0D9F96